MKKMIQMVMISCFGFGLFSSSAKADSFPNKAFQFSQFSLQTPSLGTSRLQSKTLSLSSSSLGSKKQSLSTFETSAVVYFIGLVPICIVDLVLAIGNIIALPAGTRRSGWGLWGIIFGGVTVAWGMIPVIFGATDWVDVSTPLWITGGALLALGIINVIIGDRDRHYSFVPWFNQGKSGELQAGVSITGLF